MDNFDKDDDNPSLPVSSEVKLRDVLPEGIESSVQAFMKLINTDPRLKKDERLVRRLAEGISLAIVKALEDEVENQVSHTKLRLKDLLPENVFAVAKALARIMATKQTDIKKEERLFTMFTMAIALNIAVMLEEDK